MSALFPGDEENLAFDRAEISPPCGGANHFINSPKLSDLTSLMISIKRLKTNRKKVSCKKYRGSSVHSGDKRSDLTSGRYFLLESESPNLRLILEILILNMIDPEVF